MICLAKRIMIEKNNEHDYVFDGKIIRQKGGGSMGLDLKGVVADIYMCYWDNTCRNLQKQTSRQNYTKGIKKKTAY